VFARSPIGVIKDSTMTVEVSQNSERYLRWNVCRRLDDRVELVLDAPGFYDAVSSAEKLGVRWLYYFLVRADA
jgi:hypothetical protein